MDADPVTESDSIAELAYDALIGSEFEQKHGWHVNLMPRGVLDHLPAGWAERVFTETYQDKLKVVVPSAADLLAPKKMRNEARDRAHEAFAVRLGLV